MQGTLENMNQAGCHISQSMALKYISEERQTTIDFQEHDKNRMNQLRLNDNQILKAGIAKHLKS